VLEESTPGVDGLLGMSFLGKFQFELKAAEPQGPRRLLLRPLVGTTTPLNVPIEFSASEEWWAGVLADALSGQGYRPQLLPRTAAPGPVAVHLPVSSTPTPATA
jgi:hypothetical protein